ncbi:MAG: hypothetical protein DRI80_06345 [Chloroflexota bacterium]|nr:MAG: hypothetical protein DRI80_06345 [Chloroflexota bacterium]
MIILRDVSISLTPEEVLRAQRSNRRGGVQPALMAAAREAVALGRMLVAPAAVYDEFEVRDVVGEEVILSTASSSEGEGEGRLTVGPKVDLLAPAERVIVAVYTIGPALERRVSELHAAADDLLAFMLDSVGVLALGAIGEALRDRAEKRAAEFGWGVSPALSPGSLVGWPVEGQREVCALLPVDKIGVRLNEYCVLEPHKSVSLVIGIGPGYESSHVGSVCRYCSLAKTCWRRRED